MPDRFGLDVDLDGLVDLPNTPEYAVGPGSGLFEVVLDGRLSTGTMDGGRVILPLLRYDWSIDGARLPAPVVAADGGPSYRVTLPEGTYDVSLTVTAGLPWGSVRSRVRRPVVVEDLLVVAMGDSYAAGEGNPEKHRKATGGDPLWADGVGNPGVEEAHAAAHRSTVAWPARVALALERSDRTSSVTFVSVAASGASVARGVLGPQPGTADLPQVEQVAALVGDRPIDVLLVSIGGNDIGFTEIIRRLVDADPLFDPICYRTDLANIWAAARDGDWTRASALRPGLPFGIECRAVHDSDGLQLAGLNGLPAELDRVAAALDATLQPDRVVIVEYPDPTGRQSDDGDQAVCGEIVGDTFGAFRFLEISRREQELGKARIIEPLNRIVEEAAARHGWAYASGVAGAFAAGHGYCADWPDYRPPGSSGSPSPDRPDDWYHNPGASPALISTAEPSTSWYRTARQSAILQGPDQAYRTAGTLHPNEVGHAQMAAAVLGVLADE
jgi:lysophospholipase L1-like esterase